MVPICDLKTQEGTVDAQQVWKQVSLEIGKIIVANVTQHTDVLRQFLRFLQGNKVDPYEKSMFLN